MNEKEKKFEQGMRDYTNMTYDWDNEKDVLNTMQQCQRNYDYEKWNKSKVSYRKSSHGYALY